jgi:hypothetical protein
MQDKLAYLDSKGMRLLQRGDYTGGRYAYVDGQAQLGAILELFGERLVWLSAAARLSGPSLNLRAY